MSLLSVSRLRYSVHCSGYIPGNKEIGQWHKVHPLWDEWLRKRRDTTPSDEEVKTYDAAAERRQELIKQADAREVHFVDTKQRRTLDACRKRSN